MQPERLNRTTCINRLPKFPRLELRDFIVTPIVIIVVYAVAYVVRPLVTDDVNRRYFFAGLSVKIIGALAVGFVYQFYYHGGDTYNYHTHGSRHVWQAFWDSPAAGLKLFLSDGGDQIGIYEYSSRMPFFGDTSSYMVIRIASIFDLITFSAYSATAVCFGVMSFIGGWMLFLTFYETRKHLAGRIALATLFIPSVFFLGIRSVEGYRYSNLSWCSHVLHMENREHKTHQAAVFSPFSPISIHYLCYQEIHPVVVFARGVTDAVREINSLCPRCICEDDGPAFYGCGCHLMCLSGCRPGRQG